MQRWRVVALVGAVVLAMMAALAGCSGPSPLASPGVPVVVIEGATSTTRPLDVDAVAAGAASADVLAEALRDAGFLGGTERTDTGAGRPFSRVVAQALAFETPDGALAFVTWIRDNGGSELIAGGAVTLPGVPDEVVSFRHEPDACCPREAPVYLAAWSTGEVVVVVEMLGREATDGAAARLVTRSLEGGW